MTRQLRYSKIVGSILYDIERLAVEYQDRWLSDMESRARILGWIFGLEDESMGWGEEDIRNHDWSKIAVDPDDVRDLMLNFFYGAKDVHAKRDALWKEIWAMREDWVEVEDEEVDGE